MVDAPRQEGDSLITEPIYARPGSSPGDPPVDEFDIDLRVSEPAAWFGDPPEPTYEAEGTCNGSCPETCGGNCTWAAGCGGE